MRLKQVVMIDATDLFGGDDYGDNINWQYCQARSTFVHRHCCEFVFYVGSDADEPGSYYKTKLAEMKAFGCTPEFISAYRKAKKEGAYYVFFAA